MYRSSCFFNALHILWLFHSSRNCIPWNEIMLLNQSWLTPLCSNTTKYENSWVCKTGTKPFYSTRKMNTAAISKLHVHAGFINTPFSWLFYITSNLFPTPARSTVVQTTAPPPMAQLRPDQIFSLPGCTKPKFVEPATGRRHDYCGKRHDRRAQATTGDVAHSPFTSCILKACPLHVQSLHI